jgi:hypothetical protein
LEILLLQQGTNATGNYVGSWAGTTNGTLKIINAGIGYTPLFRISCFLPEIIALTSITGTGRNATANITITNGVASLLQQISNGGTGYVIGDVLSASQVGI